MNEIADIHLNARASDVNHVSPRKPPRIPVTLKCIQWLFPKVETLFPALAHRWFAKMFFSPPKFPIPAQERAILSMSDEFLIMVRGHRVRCYAWGEGPAILLVHGWAGRASQFKSFVPHFVNEGYSVVSFDSIGHGKSKGSWTSIVDFKDAILEMEKRLGNITGIVAHSLGGGASLYAISEGLQTEKLITISTPTIGDEIIAEFSARLGASKKASMYLKDYVEKVMHRSFDTFMSTHFLRHIPNPPTWLIIHDEHDREASLENSRLLREACPTATVVHTRGLGHVRILRDEQVIEMCLDFMRA